MIYLIKSPEARKLENGEYEFFFSLKIGYTDDENTDLMKNNGASKEELGLAKKISKKAVDKYKVDSTLDLYNSIIKNKRKK